MRIAAGGVQFIDQAREGSAESGEVPDFAEGVGGDAFEDAVQEEILHGGRYGGQVLDHGGDEAGEGTDQGRAEDEALPGGLVAEVLRHGSGGGEEAEIRTAASEGGVDFGEHATGKA